MSSRAEIVKQYKNIDLTMKTSNLFNLNLLDLAKGFVIAVIGGALTAIQNVIGAGSFNLKWQQIGAVALTAGIAYLLKNFFTPAQIIVKPKLSKNGL